MSAESRLGVDALAAAVAAEGVEMVFGIVGEGNIELVSRLVHHHGVRWIGARHESAAVAMADGYARRTGRVGVASVTQGAGLTQTGTALVEARGSGSPLVLLAGAVAQVGPEFETEVSPEAFALATAGTHRLLGGVDGIAEGVRSAFRDAVAHGKPVVVSAPIDVQHAPLRQGWTPHRPVAALAEGLWAPSADAVSAAARMLEASERPLLVAGMGAVNAAAREQILALAARTGALLATSLRAKRWFAGDPWDTGVVGGLSGARHTIHAEADVVVSFGASLNIYTTDHGRAFPTARVVQVDDREDALGRHSGVELGIVADARLAAAAILDELGEGTRVGARSAEVRQRLDAAGDAAPGPEISDDDPITTAAAVSMVDAELPPRSLVVGVGNFCGYPVLGVDVPEPGRMILPWTLGAAGMALPMAVGVALADDAEPTVVFEGDGSVMFHLPELDTAARHGARLLVVVIDDAAYTAETYILDRNGLDRDLSLLPRRPLDRIARDLGLSAWRVETAAELREALKEVGSIDGPALIQVCVEAASYHTEMLDALH